MESEESERNEADSQSEEENDEKLSHDDSDKEKSPDETPSKTDAFSNTTSPEKPSVSNVKLDCTSSNSSDTYSTRSKKDTGISSGAPIVCARMIVDGGALSDDEDNSWDEELSESDGSQKDDYGEEEYDEEVSPSPVKAKEEEKVAVAGEELDEEEEEDTGERCVMNVFCTEYEIIKKVARKVLGFKLREYEEDHDGAIRGGEHQQKLMKEWDVSWHDLAISPDYLAKLNPYQKVSQFPGIYVISKKHHLARNLMRMKRAFPSEFNFFP